MRIKYFNTPTPNKTQKKVRNNCNRKISNFKAVSFYSHCVIQNIEIILYTGTHNRYDWETFGNLRDLSWETCGFIWELFTIHRMSVCIPVSWRGWLKSQFRLCLSRLIETANRQKEWSNSDHTKRILWPRWSAIYMAFGCIIHVFRRRRRRNEQCLKYCSMWRLLYTSLARHYYRRTLTMTSSL